MPRKLSLEEFTSDEDYDENRPLSMDEFLADDDEPKDKNTKPVTMSDFEVFVDASREAGHNIGKGIESFDKATGIPSTIGKGIHFLDKHIGAPMRQSIQEAQLKGRGQPENAHPSWKDIAANAGLDPTTRDLPFAANLAIPEQKRLKGSVAGAVGGTLGVVADPANYIPVGGAVKGAYGLAKPVAQHMSKIARAGAKGAAYGVTRASTGVGSQQLKHYLERGKKANNVPEASDLRINYQKDLEHAKDRYDQSKKNYDKANEAYNERYRTAKEHGEDVKKSLEAEHKKSQDILEQVYNQRLDSHKNTSVKRETFSALKEAVVLEKKFAGAMSKAIDKLLHSKTKGKRVHSFEDIDHLFTAEIKSLQSTRGYGDVTSKAIEQLQALQNRFRNKRGFIQKIKNGQPMTSVEQRELIKDLRKDIGNWDKTTFNSETDAALKNITESMNAELKKAHPDFSELMELEHRRADLHNFLDKSFRTDSKGYATVKRAVEKGDLAAEDIIKSMEEYSQLSIDTPNLIKKHFPGDFEVDTGIKLKERILNDIKEVKASQEAYKKLKEKGVKGSIEDFPDHHELIAAAEKKVAKVTEDLKRLKRQGAARSRQDFPVHNTALLHAEEDLLNEGAKYQQVKRLTEDNAHTVIKNVGNEVPNPNNVEALDALDTNYFPDEPRNYKQQFQDRGAVDVFTKDNTRGSKGVQFWKTVVGGLAGGSGAISMGLTPEAAMIIGSITGMGWDKFGGTVMKGLLDLGYFPGKSAYNKFAEGMNLTFEAGEQIAKLPKFKKFGKILETAMDRGGMQSLVVTHHMLMKTNPEYKKLIEGTNQ